MRAVQVEEKAASLNSNDCFVLETPKATYLWYGKVSKLVIYFNLRQFADNESSKDQKGVLSGLLRRYTPTHVCGCSVAEMMPMHAVVVSNHRLLFLKLLL